MRCLISILILLFYCNANCQTRALEPGEISKLIPDKIKGFNQSGDFKSKLVSFGTVRYSLVEKNFTAGKRKVKILLFDYKEAPIMYTQATKKWTSFESIQTDSLTLQSTSFDNCIGWETYNARSKNSQIMLGICERFFLTVEGLQVELDLLRQVLATFPIQSYPK